ncbi:MAG: aminotransferase class III-fold pyridoxal phosphate-dependent enzyme [Phycisphaerae bacterium]|nr:aminotransferase class III-fold pyridoxal phosphate-dependent enzyme [Phycisphaerae bacterium]
MPATASASGSTSGSTSGSSRPFSDAFAGNPAIDAAIASILAEVRKRQASITGARPASADRKETLDSWLARSAEVKGRPALYPYVGSGFGNGPLVELVDGSVKWDLINGIGVHMFGHSDPDMIEASLRGALADTCMQGNLQFNPDSIEFAELLAGEASKSSRLKYCFVTNSGCMANEQALKVCQQKTNAAPRVIAFQDCFMGRSTTMAQIGDGPAYRVGVPLNVHVDYMPFYDPDLGQRSIDMAVWHLKQYIHRYPKQHSCFVMELTQGEGGFNVAPREFFLPLMQLCKENGIPVWDDEVQTFGRTTTMFAYEQLGLGEFIDVLTLGKMSQACAVLYTQDMNPKPGLLSGTFQASTSAFAVGNAALRKLRDGGYYGADGKIAKLQKAWREHAEAFVKKHPEWFPPVRNSFGSPMTRIVSGTGGMMRLTPYGGDKDRIMKLLHRLFANGVIAFYCGHEPYHLRLLPPVGVMKPEQFGPVFEIFEKSFSE